MFKGTLRRNILNDSVVVKKFTINTKIFKGILVQVLETVYSAYLFLDQTRLKTEKEIIYS